MSNSVVITISFFRSDKLSISDLFEIDVLKLDKVNYWSIDKIDPKDDILNILENITVEGSSKDVSKGYSYKLTKAKIKGSEFEYGIWLSQPKKDQRIQIFERPAKLMKVGVLCGESIFKEPLIEYFTDQNNGEASQQISNISSIANSDGDDENRSIETDSSESSGSLRASYVAIHKAKWFDFSNRDLYVYEGTLKLGDKCHGVIIITSHGDRIILKEDLEAIERKKLLQRTKYLEAKISKKNIRSKSRGKVKSKSRKKSRSSKRRKGTR